MHGDRVACPLHDWKIHLDSGDAVAPDEGCAASFPVKLEGETIMLSPAEGFYATPGLGKNEVRIAYVLNTKDMERAMFIFSTVKSKSWMNSTCQTTTSM